MLKKILIAVVVLIVGFVAFVASRPTDFAVERSTVLTAAPEHAFVLVNDFHHWEKWSPWAKLDPNQKTTFGGAESGVGATYSWVGNEDVGEGKMEILESTPNERVKIKLEFIKPFASVATTSVMFAKEGEGTKVTWRMEGQNDFMGKAFSLFMDMDAMLGADFEKGLAAIKTEAEATHAKALADAKQAAEQQAAEQAPAGAEAAPAMVAEPTP